ncbi:MAG: hypothetical protein V1839_03490 [archaeon]
MAKSHIPMSLRELVGFEELCWLIIGLFFGWFAGKGASAMVLLIPIVIFIVWLLDWLFGCGADHAKHLQIIKAKKPVKR